MSTGSYNGTAVQSFKDWFEGKYIDWRNSRSRKDKSGIRTFALWIGLKQQTVDNYINGKRVPKGRELDMIAEKLGLEAYDAAGEERPDLRLKKLAEIWPKLSEEKREWLVKEAEQDAEQNAETTGERLAKNE